MYPENDNQGQGEDENEDENEEHDENEERRKNIGHWDRQYRDSTREEVEMEEIVDVEPARTEELDDGTAVSYKMSHNKMQTRIFSRIQLIFWRHSRREQWS